MYGTVGGTFLVCSELEEGLMLFTKILHQTHILCMQVYCTLYPWVAATCPFLCCEIQDMTK